MTTLTPQKHNDFSIILSDEVNHLIAAQFAAVHEQLATLPGAAGSPYRARNYNSAINDLLRFMQTNGYTLPDKTTLEFWKNDLLGRGLSERTVNARLSAARQLLNGMADNVPGIELKTMLRDWAKVQNVKMPIIQDMSEEDYGVRLTLNSLQAMIVSIPTRHIKGLRDRALIAFMAGAGLRVSEVVGLTVREAFLISDSEGVQCVKVNHGKGGKTRLVPLPAWVKRLVTAYTDALGIYPLTDPDEPIFRQVKPARGKGFVSLKQRLSVRGAERAVNAYEAHYQGDMIRVNAHDLRRTYAKLSRSSGMEWEDLRDNLGHASVMTTEKYVGKERSLEHRRPKWAIEV